MLVSPAGSILSADGLNGTECFCLAYSPTGAELVAGCGDGSLHVFSTVTGSLTRVKQHANDPDHLPTTCIKFNPSLTNGNQLLLAVTADGSISHWNVTDQNTSCVRQFKEENSSVYAVDYRADGGEFATGGRDHVVRVYDEATGTLVRSFDNAGAHGHSNRVFAVKYAPEEHTIVSGGWDQTVQIWDTRTGYSVRSIYGPHICGDALDCSSSGKELLTGSWRETDALERWDFGSGKRIDSMPWNRAPTEDATTAAAASHNKPEPNCMLYACSYSPDERLIAAGGAGNGVNQAKLFDAQSGEPIERVSFTHGLYALAFAPDGTKLALGGVDTHLTIVDHL